MSDITLAVGDGARRMTYAEIAEARGISLPSARRLVLRHHWPRQAGNDGIVRVTVPLIALVNGPETEGFSVTTTDPTTSHATTIRRWCEWLVCSAYGSRNVDMVVTGTERR